MPCLSWRALASLSYQKSEWLRVCVLLLLAHPTPSLLSFGGQSSLCANH